MIEDQILSSCLWIVTPITTKHVAHLVNSEHYTCVHMKIDLSKYVKVYKSRYVWSNVKIR